MSRRAISALLLMIALTGCSSAGDDGDAGNIGAAPPRAPEQANLTFEDASFVASGELVRLLGIEADPVPVEVTGSREVLDGRGVWRLDMQVDVTVDGERERQEWVMWVAPGLGSDQPEVVRAERTSD